MGACSDDDSGSDCTENAFNCDGNTLQRCIDGAFVAALVRAEAPFVGTGMESVVARDSGAAIGARRTGIVDQVDATRIVIRATEDLDPAHIDPDWCAHNSPWGTPIAFGFLTVSMLWPCTMFGGGLFSGG